MSEAGLSGPATWEVEVRRGRVADLHREALPVPGSRRAVLCLPVDSALVMGSTQEKGLFDVSALRRAEFDLVRRRSGGGAVLVDHAGMVWVNLFIPSNDTLWEQDVSRSGLWLGRMWKRVLESLGITAEMTTAERVDEGDSNKVLVEGLGWTRQVCFARLSAGELSVEGRKVVGVSQRRNRDGAVFHCAVLLRWRSAELSRFFVTSFRRVMGDSLDRVAIGIEDLLGPRARAEGRGPDEFGLAPGGMASWHADLWKALVSELPL